MRVLIACEESQIGCLAFRNRGHEAYSCDIVDCSGGHPEWHIKADVFDVLDNGWDMMIAHPVCTYLCNSGVRWLYKNGHKNYDRWGKMYAAALFFRDLFNANIEKIVIENPIMHKYARKIIEYKYDQIIQPWQFGHGETKATCLHILGLPLLQPTDIVKGREHRIHKMAPSTDRGRLRSRSYPGILKAMANQWG